LSRSEKEQALARGNNVKHLELNIIVSIINKADPPPQKPKDGTICKEENLI
jgi:hypothetical protein